MTDEYNLGPAPKDHESYEVTAEWDSEQRIVFIKDWNPYDSRFLNFQPLTPEQMDNLVAWWQREKSQTGQN